MRERTRLSYGLILLVLGALIGTAYCTKAIFGDRWKPPCVVTIEGGEDCVQSPMMAWVACPDGKTGATILVREGDMLAIEGEGKGTAFPYLQGDGTFLSVAHDDYGLLLGGRRVFVDLEREGTAQYLAKKAGQEELAHIRMCRMEGPVPETGSLRYSAIQRLAQINPNAGWFVEERAVLRYVLRLFDPRWLIIEGGSSLEEEDFRLISNEPALEYLFIPLKSRELRFLRCPEKLRILAITEWDSEKTGPLTGDWVSLRILKVFGFAMKDLSPIASLKGLDELHILLGERLSDISALRGLTGLKALNLSGCEKVDDLSVLKGLNEIQWLGLPPDTTQKEFEEILCDHPDLRVLEMVDCKKIKDLSPLQGLKNLERFVLLNEEIDYAPLSKMKQLRFLALSEEAFEKPAQIVGLKKALPDCRIVKAKPFCLGSGWILLLLPAVPLALFLSDLLSSKRARPIKRNG